ncbi:MAG: spermidine/putrescine ABC transporter substrate-binding protein [Actinobacteria bacterium]|nr:MAG: spermidine/putrescine ABC transporter substrate-binding protein [Actinomycetota bacterium]
MPSEDIDGIVERMLDGSEHSRRQFIRHLAGAGLLLGPGSAFLAACGGVKGESSGKKASTAVNHPKVPIGDWTFSNWPLYIDKSVLKSFDKKYGGHVKYVEDINDNFEFFGKVRQQLAAGKPIGRDIVTLTDYMAARWVRDGYVTAIDKKNVPNAKNLVSNLQTIGYDPHRNFTLPWQSGAIGIGYDPRKTGRKLHSIQDFFDPKFKGRVSFLSEPYDSAGMVMLMQGVDSTHANIDQINKAIDKIEQAQKAGQIRRFTGNDYTTDLTKGNLWVAMAYSGDLTGLQADNPHLEFVYPDEGSMIFTDNMMIPAKAAHPYAAETMMNYVYDPAVAAKLAAYITYISPVQGAADIIRKTNPKLADSPLIFPSDAIRKKFHPYPNLSPADEREMEERMAQVTGA